MSKKIKSVLRYPGGKSRAVKHILPLIPEGTEKLCSPFLGGGSIELACASKGITVYAYDSFQPLVDFWLELLKNPEALADKIEKYYPLSKKHFIVLQDIYRFFNDSLTRAASFYVLNRASYSGTTLSGGMSKNHPRFTKSSIDSVRNFKVDNFYVGCSDFKDSINKHKDCLLYLDPPYMNNQALYGRKGDLHENFNHELLYDLLSKRRQWILSYNDCEEIRKLYKNYQMVNPEWKYGMSKDKSSKEIIIVSKDINIPI